MVELLLQDRQVSYEGGYISLYSLLDIIHNYALFSLLVRDSRFDPSRITGTILHDPVKLAIVLPYIDTTDYFRFWEIYH